LNISPKAPIGYDEGAENQKWITEENRYEK